MGLLVVSRLAKRHGIFVELERNTQRRRHGLRRAADRDPAAGRPDAAAAGDAAQSGPVGRRARDLGAGRVLPGDRRSPSRSPSRRCRAAPSSPWPSPLPRRPSSRPRPRRAPTAPDGPAAGCRRCPCRQPRPHPARPAGPPAARQPGPGSGRRPGRPPAEHAGGPRGRATLGQRRAHRRPAAAPATPGRTRPHPPQPEAKPGEQSQDSIEAAINAVIRLPQRRPGTAEVPGVDRPARRAVPDRARGPGAGRGRARRRSSRRSPSPSVAEPRESSPGARGEPRPPTRCVEPGRRLGAPRPRSQPISPIPAAATSFRHARLAGSPMPELTRRGHVDLRGDEVELVQRRRRRAAALVRPTRSTPAGRPPTGSPRRRRSRSASPGCRCAAPAAGSCPAASRPPRPTAGPRPGGDPGPAGRPRGRRQPRPPGRQRPGPSPDHSPIHAPEGS